MSSSSAPPVALPSQESSLNDSNLQSLSQSQVDDQLAYIKPRHRRRWRFRLRRRGGSGGDKPNGGWANTKPLAFQCGCKSVIRGSCLILLSSFIELLGCLIALVYGIAYIQTACNFYQLDSDPEIRERTYAARLGQVLYLERNRVGFVGILATCLIGLVIAILMPIGTIYKSWKSIRAAMTLLFSVCVIHVILVSFYLHDSDLVATIAVVPFRVGEFFLLWSFIKYHKRKKLEALRERGRVTEVNELVATTVITSNNAMENASLNSFDKEEIMQLVEMSNGEIVKLATVIEPRTVNVAKNNDTIMASEVPLSMVKPDVTPVKTEELVEAINKGEKTLGGLEKILKKHKQILNKRKKEDRAPHVTTEHARYLQYDAFK